MSKNDLPGFNVVGHLRAASGLGNTARLFIDVLTRKGHAVAGLDVDEYADANTAAALPGTPLFPAEQLPFQRTLIVVALARLPHLWIKSGPTLLRAGHRIAGLIFWELPVIPRAWLPSLRLFDAALACSHYVRQAFETAVPEVPTVFAEHPLNPFPTGHRREQTRRRFGIPQAAVAFCCSFDPRSGFVRKNTVGAIAAWRQAFPQTAEACLVIKMNGTANLSEDREYLRLLSEIRSDPRIILIGEQLSHDDVMQLFDCCDVFVSLHRSEGLGLVPMEAMSLGKLVIATGYSGNVTFMTGQNSMPVPYHLIEPRGDVPFFLRKFAGKNAAWAEPDLTAAAAMMRRSANDEALRDQLGRRAASDIAARQQDAWGGKYFDELLFFLDRSDRERERRALRREVLLQELLDPTIRAQNVAKLSGRWKR
jgi:glycosyltransferase involved in cell wall biosynthesis